MNTASDPYSTALLITMSMSYSRYFSTAIAIAAHRHTNARLPSTLTTATLVKSPGTSVTTTSTAAAANHFSCSRSSPDDRANLTTSAATLTTSAAAIRQKIAVRLGAFPLNETNGCDQMRVALMTKATAATANAAPTHQAAGRHRRDRRCPVGNSRNTKASTAKAITHPQLDNQAAARPAGSDPGAATRACSAYDCKLLSPSTMPAVRNSQPIRFAGRLEARTKPT